MTRNSLRRCLKGFAAGALLGGLWAFFQPHWYLGESTVFFPGLNRSLFTKLAQALQADPSMKEVPLTETPTLAQENLARLILASASASSAAGLEQPATLTAVSGGLVLQVRSKSAEGASHQLERLLEYYDAFVKDHPTSSLSRTRRLLEDQLAAVAQHLRKTEEKMALSSDPQLRALGDGSGKVDSKVLAQVWLKRSEEQAVGRALLDTLQQLREQHPGQNYPVSDWTARWSPRGAATSRPRLGVRRQSLLARLKLERSYADTLLKYRSLVLQHGFLKTLESLDSAPYEIVDPPRARKLGKGRLYAWSSLAGALLGLVGAVLWQAATDHH